MTATTDTNALIAGVLAITHPFDGLSKAECDTLSAELQHRKLQGDEIIYAVGDTVEALYLIVDGRVDILSADGVLLSILGPGNFFGERGLVRDGIAPVTAKAEGPGELIGIPAAVFHRLMEKNTHVERYFRRGQQVASKKHDLMTAALGDVMTPKPLTCSPSTTLHEAAQAMRDRRVSCILVTEEERSDQLLGIVTTRDLTTRALAEARPYDTPIYQLMTREPISMPPQALISDVMNEMIEGHLTHMPVTDRGHLVGILTQTDITRVQAMSSGWVIQAISEALKPHEIAEQVKTIPDLLVQLVGAHNAHNVVTRLITDIGDAATRRLLKLAEEKLGPPPTDYLWLACGSQGRQEQTGVSDQDNILILADDATEDDDVYFSALAKFVSDGLDLAGYFYCPGDMMATAPRWRQPLSTWRGYFKTWVDKPDPMAQMLASVMFDLRPIGGKFSLFDDLQDETLAMASANSIFVAHMTANSLKHHPPLGLFRGLATVRAGEHKNTIDLKHNGVVPVVDLGRIYALKGQIAPANTRERLEKAMEVGALSGSGGRDLIDAYDLIAELRLQHQAEQIKLGQKPDNFMSPSNLSDFERSHLRDAFVVIKTMQNAAGARGGTLN